MTDVNYDTEVMEACKHYMRITDIKPEEFIDEILDLASQYVTNLPDEIVREKREKAAKLGKPRGEF